MKIRNLIFSVLAITAVAGGLNSLALAHDDKGDRDKFEKAVKEVRSIGSTIEVHFNNDGKVIVRGAKVTSVSGSTINAAVAWGSYSLNWVVVTDATTKFIRKHGGASSVSEVSVGDFLSFQGHVDTTQSQATVKADIVKDWSLVEKANAKMNMEGTLKSIAGTTTPTTLVLTIKGVDYTVNVPGGISILNKNWQIVSLSSFRIGDTVRVYGSLRTDSTATIDATVVRDTSI